MSLNMYILSMNSFVKLRKLIKLFETKSGDVEQINIAAFFNFVNFFISFKVSSAVALG
jgi:hypothetical protein